MGARPMADFHGRDAHDTFCVVQNRLYRNARLATMNPATGGIGEIVEGALAISGDRITYAGPQARLPADLAMTADAIDCQGRWITPGLIDCHTHLVHAGDRSVEFEMRLAGATYEQIARAGGGIASSVKALRETSEESLLRQSLPRLDALLAEGVTTIEIKSGYGLDLANEIKSLRVARELGRHREVTVVTSFLGAHTIPAEAKSNRAEYLQLITEQMLPAIAEQKLADAVDGFCETIAFSPDEIRTVFTAALKMGLPVKLHADQLSNQHAAVLAAECGALSADHLEHSDEAGITAMARAGTTAVLLPGAFYFLQDTRKPPVDLLRKYRVPIAIGTDCNPGTSPLTSLLLAMNMGATLFGLTVDECLIGVTRWAAKALGRGNDIGTLEAGKFADLAIWNIDRPAELVYRMGLNPLHARIFHGKVASGC